MNNTLVKLLVITLLLGISALLNSCYEEETKERDPACKMLPKPGRCKGRMESFFFDQKSGKCQTFYWGGCGGSRPFVSLEECRSKCL